MVIVCFYMLHGIEEIRENRLKILPAAPEKREKCFKKQSS
jgi:hypothetical protein